MSIKIHKVLGYGTDKLEMKGDVLKDPRFTAEGFHRAARTGISEDRMHSYSTPIQAAFVEEFVDGAKAERLLAYVREEVVTLDRKARSRGNGRLCEMGVHYEFESSDIPAVVFVPPNVEGWTRDDDVIDYHEHGLGVTSSFRYLDVSYIFPLTGEMRRFRGQRRFDWEPKNVEGGHYNHLTGRFSGDDPKPLLEGDDLEDMLENWRPTLPWMLLAWIQMQGWITDKKGFADMLRPCIYVYWS